MLDVTNRALVAALIQAPRASFAALGRQVGLSAPAVAERLARLEADGVVHHRVEVDPAALGLPLTAWVRIRPLAKQLPKLTDLARRTSEVTLADRVSGEDCLMIRLHIRSMEHLEELLDAFLPFGQTTSSFVVASPVPARTLPADDQAADR